MKSHVCVGCPHWLPIQSFLGPALPWEVLWLYHAGAWLVCGDPILAVRRAEGANFSRFAYVVGAFPLPDRSFHSFLYQQSSCAGSQTFP